jgi:lipoprotein-anchoring transpeptidase ErfK/SrfK
MSNRINVALLAGASLLSFALHRAFADEAGLVSEPIASRHDRSPERPLFAQPRRASAERSNPRGGFIEFVFGDRPGQGDRYRQQEAYQPQPSYQPQRVMVLPWEPQQTMSPQYGQQYLGEPVRPAFDPKYEKQIVEYNGKESPGTIVIDTANKFLYLVQADGRAMRYGIGVGRPGFTWSGIKQISAKREWPDWTPPAEMLARRPDLPRHMEGGPENPLGARAMYLGSSLYRIHGSNEPWTIGTNVSSGCIRMRNEDVIDLYDRVNVGTRVVVI